MELYNLTVGEKLDHDMPAESMSIVLMNNAPMLTFNFSLTEMDIATFLNGATSFGLFAERNSLFFLFKIDGFMDWSDLAFTIHLAGDETVENNAGYLPFNLVLVDSATHIIKALRMVTVSPAFRTMLVQIIINQQTQEKFDTIAYYKEIGALYETYPSAEAMLKKAPLIEQGGVTLPGK